VEDARITISNNKIEELIGHINFYSATYRLFKIEELEPACEDYGQAVIYRGGIITPHKEFILDAHHAIQVGKIFLVCNNTYLMLKKSRFAPFFEFIGDQSIHFGIFQGCGTTMPFSSIKQTETSSNKSSCC